MREQVFLLRYKSEPGIVEFSGSRSSASCQHAAWAFQQPIAAKTTSVHGLRLKTENTLNFSKYTTIFFKVYSCHLKFITVLWWPHSCSIFITMVKVRLFCWWCCVCCIVLFTLCILILWACHDHNKTAPCGMIKVFLEFNWIICIRV